MADLSVSLIAASDSDLFTVPTHYPRDNTSKFISKLDSDDVNISIYGARAGRRAVSVHRAIATVLVSQPTDEVIAVGTSKTKDSLFTIYITASGTSASFLTLHKARQHLEDVWNRLSSLVNEQPLQGKETPQELDLSMSSSAFDFGLCIYRYSIEKVIERFKKSRSLGVRKIIAEVVSGAAEYVMDKPGETEGRPYIQRRELDALSLLAAVFLAFEDFQENRSDDNLRQLTGAIEIACVELDRLGTAVWGEGSNSLFSRCDRLMKERTNASLQKPAAFHRFWKKAFQLHRAMKQLLYLTVSPTMRHQLKAPFAVEVVPPQSGSFQYDFTDPSFRAVFSRAPQQIVRTLSATKNTYGSAIESDSSSGSQPVDINSGGSSHVDSGSNASTSSDSQLTYDRFIDSFSKKWPLANNNDNISNNVHLHCELTLLTYFLTHGIEAYGFIAISKLCCLGCWFYFLAYNEVAEKRGRRLYHVLGTHSKAYRGWIKPPVDPAVDREIEPILANCAEIHFQSVKNQFSPRNWSDSTAGSSGNVKLGLDAPFGMNREALTSRIQTWAQRHI